MDASTLPLAFTVLLVVVTLLWRLGLLARFTSGSNSSAASALLATQAALRKKSASGSSTAASQVSNLPLSIFFGSQSGTSETLSLELAQEARTYGFSPSVIDLADFDAENDLSEERCAIFLMSTFGEGEPTDNAQSFCEYIHSPKAEELNPLSELHFAVFALGNKQYQHFCNVGRQLDARLDALHATRLVPHGEGDDDANLEDDFLNWKRTMWRALRHKFIPNFDELTAEQTEIAQHFKPSLMLEVLPATSDFAQKYKSGLASLKTDPKHKVARCKVLENRELRQCTSEGSTRHIELQLKGTVLQYETADNMGVYPRNDEHQARALCKRLQQQPDSVFRCSWPGKKNPYPPVCSVLDALLWYCDFCASPRLAQLPILAQYTEDTDEKSQLMSFARERKDEYVADHLSYSELFDMMPNLKMSLLDFLELVPKLQPRFYTISSSSLVQPNTASLTVSLTKHTKPRNRIQFGICSAYLCALQPDDEVCVFIRESTFKFPHSATYTLALAQPAMNGSTAPKKSDETNARVRSRRNSALQGDAPIIMVGPGTGLAPFRGFLQEARHLREQGHAVGEMHLFFGCRQRDKDFIYESELTSAQEQRVLAKLHTAFSRESASDSVQKGSSNGTADATSATTSKKVYVQDRMSEHGSDLWQALDAQKGSVFVCGGTSMGRGVRDGLQRIAVQYGDKTEQQAIDYVSQLQKEGRFVQELWS